MARFALFIALGSLIALAPALAQQQQPAWPDPPGAQQPPPADTTPGQQQPPKRAKKAAKQAPKTPAPEPPDPRFEEEPGLPNAPGGQPPGAPRPKGPGRQAALNILCEGPFGKDASHDRLAKAFGARNVVAQGVPPTGGSTVLFPNDPKRRLEVTWRDTAGRRRPASVVVEGQSTWRARSFRLGDPLTQVEKANGKPFRLAGFGGEAGGAARDWQGGKLDKLSGGCVLGMRFAPDPRAPADARAKVATGDLVSGNPDVKAVKPTIVELILAYPE